MTSLKKVSIKPQKMSLETIMNLYRNLPHSEKETFLEKCITPEDRDIVEEAIYLEDRATAINQILKGTKECLNYLHNVNFASNLNTHEESLGRIATNILLTLSDNDLEGAIDILKKKHL